MDKPQEEPQTETPPALTGKAGREIMAMETGAPIAAVIPRTFEEAFRMAQAVILAGLAPDSYKNDAQKVCVGILKALEVGLPPITGLSTIAIINGRPSIYGDGAVALCQSRGVVDQVSVTYEGEEGSPEYTAVYRIWRRGQALPYEGRFSRKDAERAGLLKKPGPWIHYPNRMLFNRARAYALRDGFADCLSGLSIAEEMQDVTIAPQAVDTTFLADAGEIEPVASTEPQPIPA
jgi:hypothetical protein